MRPHWILNYLWKAIHSVLLNKSFMFPNRAGCHLTHKDSSVLYYADHLIEPGIGLLSSPMGPWIIVDMSKISGGGRSLVGLAERVASETSATWNKLPALRNLGFGKGDQEVSGPGGFPRTCSFARLLRSLPVLEHPTQTISYPEDQSKDPLW